MREYVRDSDGDVWERDETSEMWCSPGLTARTYAEISTEFGPLSPCDAEGDPLDTQSAARVLVAAAFEDFATRLSTEWTRTPMRYNPFATVARETADAIRTGQLTVPATHP